MDDDITRTLNTNFHGLKKKDNLIKLPSLTALKELYLSNTQRTSANLPQSLEGLANTIEIIDLSKNDLNAVPGTLLNNICEHNQPSCDLLSSLNYHPKSL